MIGPPPQRCIEVSEIIGRIKALSPDKRRLLALRNPLSFAQERLWVLNEMAPEAPLYNVPCAIRLTGAIDRRVLEQSLNEIVRRHQVLRTIFATVDALPIQVALPGAYYPIALVDMSEVAEHSRRTATLSAALREARRPFNLSAGPLVRWKLLRLTGSEHLLVIVLHHVVADGWSMGVLVRELCALYEAYLDGRPSPLGEMTTQYADFARRQRRALSGAALKQELDYWTAKLAGSSSYLDLPTDRPRPNATTWAGGSVASSLSEELTERLKLLSRQEGATLFMTLLTAFNILLYRYSGQSDVLVGAPIANRLSGDVADLIGLFVNTIVIRSNMDAGKSLDEALRGVAAATLEAYEHQELPFEKLVQELRPERAASHSPIIQVMMVLQNAPMPPIELPRLHIDLLDLPTGTAKFDLSLSLTEADGLKAEMSYSSELYDSPTVQRMLHHYERVLAILALNPKLKIGEMDLLCEEERRQIIHEWNDSARDYTEEGLPILFERQVLARPESIAVIHLDERLTYGELNRRANALAHRLARMGTRPETPIGLCLDRSSLMVIGMLGILKAGACYTPLDPAYPKARLEAMIVGAPLRLILTTSGFVESLPKTGTEVVCLDLVQSEVQFHGDENPPRRVTPDNLAYVMYTSGSTGTPKGASITHRAIANLLIDTNHARFSPSDCVGQVSNASFDLVTFEIWGALINGARLAILPKDAVLSPPVLAEELENHAVSILLIATALLNETARRAPWAFAGVRDLLFGGEAADPRRVGEVLANRRFGRVINIYGPTECTTYATFHVVESGDCDASSIPIGRPVSNAKAYVLDAGFDPLPIGASGELCIGGDGLARGYFNRPDLTAEQFRPDPFSAVSGARTYRSGDKVKYLADGKLAFLGRMDDQVKVRGYRIEPAEIQAMLNGHPAIAEALVIIKGGATAKKLVGYFLTRPGAALGESELRRYLKQNLPDYMVPNHLVRLTQIPLTPNGKIDKSALPDPDADDERVEYERPRTPVEEIVAGVWEDLLDVRRVGIFDDFFEVGGHSMLAAQAVSKIRAAFEIDVTLTDLFSNPTVQSLAGKIEEARKSIGSPAPGSIKAEGARRAKLSFAQQRLWFLHQWNGGSPVYNVPLAARLEGYLNQKALELSLNEIVERHEVLRTAFIEEGGEPAQEVRDREYQALSLVDLSAIENESLRESLAYEIQRKESRRTFDLANGPLIRWIAIRLAGDRHSMSVVMHHIVSDGWSIGVLLREVSALYRDRLSGRRSTIEEPPIQYIDYARWQRQRLEGEVLDSLLEYWKRKWTGRTFEIPTDRPRPIVESHHGATARLPLGGALEGDLKRACRREGLTMFMSLLAGLDLVLSRYSGREQVAVGVAAANRDRIETEGLIGFFVNTLLIQVDLAGEPTAAGLLRRARNAALEAYARQELPFERLVEELQPERSASRNPLFQVMMTLQNTPAPALDLQGLTVSGFALHTSTAKVDLNFAASDGPSGVVLDLEYNTDLYDRATIERMLSHFNQALISIVRDLDQPLSRISLMTEPETQQVLREWNANARDYDLEVTLHEMFQRRVERRGAAVAVEFEGRYLTYEELNNRANQLAAYLRRMGLHPGGLAGVSLERGIEMVVAVLGVLKAGAAYVPLDPDLPTPRLNHMIQDAGIRVLIGSRRETPDVGQAAGLPPMSKARESTAGDNGAKDSTSSEIGAASFHETVRRDDLIVIRVDADSGEIACESKTNLNTGVTPLNLAYVIYTSGSTGAPKGAMNTHRGVCNRLIWMQEAFRLTGDDRVLQKTPISFDVSVWELFWPLIAGARLVLARPEGHRDPEYLAEMIARSRVTTLHFVPSMLQVFLESADLKKCGGVKRVISSGEALGWELQERFFSRINAELHNLYGPTEAAIDVTSWRCRPGQPAGPIPIGRPIANIRICVLDHTLAPSPIGIPGELHIGGVGLSNGYVNRPELTAEKFIPDPFAEPGERLYKTGDLARFLPGGDIQYLGRLDHQVKIRGFRIEMGEIEAELNRLPDVAESAVAAVENGRREKQLVAYVVPVDRASFSEQSVRRRLRERLPDYMTPAAVLTLDRLPLTPNGKLDRRALPQPETIGSRAEFVAPRSTVEEILAGIWSEVIGAGSIGAYDNFFELGGHSLLAVRAAARVQQVFQVPVPLSKCFELPKLADFADYVERELAADAKVESEPLLRLDRHSPAPLSYSQERMLWFEMTRARWRSVSNMCFALKITGALDPRTLKQAITEIATRHDVLRTRIVFESGRPLQAVDAPLDSVFNLVDLRETSNEERIAAARALIEREVNRRFDLLSGPLFCFTLAQFDDADQLLILSVHHVIFDGWSLGVLMNELISLYRALSAGERPALPEPAFQYREIVDWRQRTHGDSELEYWVEKLRDVPTLLKLPADWPRPEEPSYDGAVETLILPNELKLKLNSAAAGQGVTLFVALLAAFKAMLYSVTGEEDIVVGSPDADRNRLETENLIGLFVVTLMIRTRLSAGLRFAELLRQVREEVLEAYAHRYVSIPKVAEALQQDRDLGDMPLYQVIFGLQSFPAPPPKPDGFSIEPYPTGVTASKFDLSMFCRETPAGVDVSVVYRTELFRSSTVREMLAVFNEIIIAVSETPLLALSSLPRFRSVAAEYDLVGESKRR